MRKMQQAKIFELLNTLQKAQDELRKISVSDLITSLLADCQEFAFHIGQYIENIEGEGTKTVVLLEEYCDIAYKASLENGKKEYIKLLKKHLLKIENSVRSELKPNKIEVVFFPYMLSMFDAFESVYVAAKADHNCDVYVVPIPWFNRHPDGSLGEMHYDGDQYPEHINVTYWKDYDVEAQHPDIIYIHNPYDDSNYVTSVYPDYYSKRLCNFTECLVYIPYFVSAGTVAKEFCVVPGCLYAHKIILESEKIRDVYIQEFKGKYGNDHGQLKDKFIALGSPKYDAIINSKQEDFELPKDWNELIYNADGTKKKVVFYNTSVSTALQGRSEYLNKLRSVLSIFKERDDVVLWWRPHPLNKMMYQSMLPQLLGEYEKIIAQYEGKNMKGKSTVILDQSPNLYCAIALSDAYFGDRASSLVALYEQTGNPMMFQKINILDEFNEELEDDILHSDIISFGTRLLSIEKFKNEYSEWHDMWLSYRNESQSMYVAVADVKIGLSSSINAMYDIDIDKGILKYLRSFPNERNIPFIYRFMIRINNKIIFCPNRSRKWAFYDSLANKWTYEPIPQDLYPSSEGGTAFNSGVLYGDSIIYTPGESKAFAKYNIATGKIGYHTECRDSLEQMDVDFDLSMLSGVIVYGSSLLLFSLHSNCVIELNPYTMQFIRYYSVGAECYGVKSCILIPGTNKVYLIKYRKKGQLPWTETILKWDIQTGDIKEFNDLPIYLKPEYELNALNRFIFWKNTLFVTPLQGDSILQIDIGSDAITRLILSPQFDFFDRKSENQIWAKDQALPYVLFDAAKINFMAQLPYDYELADIDFDKGEILNRRKWIVEGAEWLFKTKGRYPTSTFYENQYFGLGKFLDQLVSGGFPAMDGEQCSVENNKEATQNSGELIHEYIKAYIL